MPIPQQGMYISDPAQLGPDTVGTSEIVTDGVGTAEIASGAVAADEIATSAVGTAEIDNGTIVNEDISASAAIVDTKLATISTAGKVDGAALTGFANIPAGAGNIPAANLGNAGITVKIGATTKDANDASATQDIAHGLGATPKLIRLTLAKQTVATNSNVGVVFVYDGTTSAGVGSWNIGSTLADAVVAGKIRIFMSNSGSYSEGTVTMGATNISIAWVRTGNDASTTYDILWEAFG